MFVYSDEPVGVRSSYSVGKYSKSFRVLYYIIIKNYNIELCLFQLGTMQLMNNRHHRLNITI